MKNQVPYLLLLISLLANTSLFPAAPTEDRNVAMEITQIEGQTKIPSLVKKISSTENALNFIKKRANCFLLDYTQCRKPDLLTLHYALGFLVGLRIPIGVVAVTLKKYGKIDGPIFLVLSETIAELIVAPSVGIKGIATQPFITAIFNIMSSAGLVFADVATMWQGSPLQFIKSLGSYIASNAQCVWSESHCKVSTFKGVEWSPFERRSRLYFWLGFISGAASRMSYRHLFGPQKLKIKDPSVRF